MKIEERTIGPVVVLDMAGRLVARRKPGATERQDQQPDDAGAPADSAEPG